MKFGRKAQVTVEYVALVVIIIGTLVGIQLYFKRGISGRWKASLDGLGDQYDPRYMNTDITFTLAGDSLARIEKIDGALNGANGHWTIRSDQTNSVELKQGYSRVVGYND